MSRKPIYTDAAPKPLPHFSQAIVANGFAYVSGNVGLDPATNALVEGGVGARTVGIACFHSPFSCRGGISS